MVQTCDKPDTFFVEAFNKGKYVCLFAVHSVYITAQIV